MVVVLTGCHTPQDPATKDVVSHLTPFEALSIYEPLFIHEVFTSKSRQTLEIIQSGEIFFLFSKLYGIDATIKIFVFVLYCIVLYFIV